jgi:glycosyltransferase involved in cell wall biosynthesis
MTPRRRFSPEDPAVARLLLGLADLPTVVAVGPFDVRAHAEQLAAAFTAVRRRCHAQFVLVGRGVHRAAIVRRTFSQGARSSVHVVAEERWADLLAAADVVVPSTGSGSRRLLEVLAAGRPVVAPVNPTTARLVVPSSAGLVYRPGDVSGMAGAVLRLLTTPALRDGMGRRAREVARRHHMQRIGLHESEREKEHA